jgi:hypothetical protein
MAVEAQVNVVEPALDDAGVALGKPLCMQIQDALQ